MFYLIDKFHQFLLFDSFRMNMIISFLPSWFSENLSPQTFTNLKWKV